MSAVIHTLICTVGTSLFQGNLARLDEHAPNRPGNWAAIRAAFDAEDWAGLAREMLQVKPTERVCGAEINTVEEVRRRPGIDLQTLVFLVSDTDDGRHAGRFLECYYAGRRDLDVRAEYRVIKDLQDRDPARFRGRGLRNLVRAVGEVLQRAGGPEFIAIDATGGYKAQIAIAVIVGQALEVPVFYKHERFSAIIDFPPLPISFDDAVLAANADLLTLFERGEVLAASDLGEVGERLRVLLTEVEIDDETFYELNPIGQVYLTAFRVRNPRPVNLVPAAERRLPSFRDDHYPIGFRDFVNRVWERHDWIISCHSLPYDRQRAMRPGFRVREVEGRLRLVGEYIDRNRFGARFHLLLTDESLGALAWAADRLNRGFPGGPPRP